MKNSLYCLLVLLLLGCEGERFELGKDSEGRTIRLDKQTGEVELVDSLVSAPADGHAAPVPPPAKPARPAAAADGVILVELLGKRYSEADYQNFVYFDLRYSPVGLEKPSRAIKGKLLLQDLFGETRMVIGWTIDDQMFPGQTLDERGTGFRYNQFMEDHQWTRNADLNDMKAVFRTQSVLYDDGSRQDFD